MKLWLIRPVTGEDEIGIWSPWYDKAFGFVIRAETEKEARTLAKGKGGANYPAWTSADHSTCVKLTPEGEGGIIMQDFHAA